MASQQVLFAETIAGLKRALKRKPYESDSDDEVEGTSNRGNKLQRRARYVRQGQISVPSGPAIYKEIVEHAGYQRAIIHRNPVPVDDEGYGLDSDDDEDYIRQVTAAAAQNNPYSSIRLERILGPLTSTTDLANHPTLSCAYSSRALTKLSVEGRDIMHKENQSLWKVRHLLTQLCGDHAWGPSELMEGLNDPELFMNSFSPLNSESNTAELNPEISAEGQPIPQDPKLIQRAESVRDHPTRELDKTDYSKTFISNASTTAKENGKDTGLGVRNLPLNSDGKNSKGTLAITSADISEETAEKKNVKMPKKVNGTGHHTTELDIMDVDSLSNTRQEKEVPKPNRAKPSGPLPKKPNEVIFDRDVEADFIHPLFLQPESCLPDRNFFLPQEEAEELRRLLQLYVQRQEEICRGTRQLYEGLLKADRLRKMVLFWSKAEAHCGSNRELSDGEDWYDKEEWGLDDDLKKGHDDEEEEAQQNQKKTRNRR